MSLAVIMVHLLSTPPDTRLMDIPLMESHVEPTAVFVVLRVQPPQQTLHPSRIQYFVSICVTCIGFSTGTIELYCPRD